MARLEVLLLGLGLSLSLGLLSACATQAPATSPTPELSAQQRFGDRPGVTVLATVPAAPVQGQTVYVPVYSEIFDSDQNRAFQLTVTLSLRNTDRSQPIVIDTLNYYNSAPWPPLRWWSIAPTLPVASGQISSSGGKPPLRSAPR